MIDIISEYVLKKYLFHWDTP